MQNSSLDDISFVSGTTCLRDKATGALLLNTKDFVVSRPTTEYELRSNPAVMRTIYAISKTVSREVFVVDYRHIGFPRCEELGSDEGLDTDRFRSYQQERRTVFPEAVLFNRGGAVQFVGPSGLLPAAKHIMNTVDDSLRSTALAPFVYGIRPQIKDAEYTNKPIEPAQDTAVEPEIVRFEAQNVPADLPNIVSNVLGLAGRLVVLDLLNGASRGRA